METRVLGAVQPGTRYKPEVRGELLILQPEQLAALSLEEKAAKWLQWASSCFILVSSSYKPEEKAAKWLQWASSHSSNNANLPDEALRRENIYD